jgi:hypothetical protein
MSLFTLRKLGFSPLAQTARAAGAALGVQSRFYGTVRDNAQGLEYLQNNNRDWTESQKTVREAISKLMTNFPDEYWLEIDKTGRWPTECASVIVSHPFRFRQFC